jgi:hypothetical protein
MPDYHIVDALGEIAEQLKTMNKIRVLALAKDAEGAEGRNELFREIADELFAVEYWSIAPPESEDEETGE